MTEKNKLISIVVPVYNVEQYLKQCVDSILKQTYKNIEIILVDDGSKDNSGKICDEYCKKYENCRVIHKKNAGLGMARNSGLKIIKGRYVSFVDSDDWIKPDAIEQLYNALTEKKVDFCKCGFIRFRNDEKVLRSVQYQAAYFSGDEAKKSLLPRMVGSSPSQHDSIEMCVWGVLYNAEIITEHGLQFPSERVLISEDLVFNIDYMQYADGACLIPYEGYMYRYNPKSLTLSYRNDRFEAVTHFYYEIQKKLFGYGYEEDTILRLKRIYFVYVLMCIVQERRHTSNLPFLQSVSNIKSICEDDLLNRNIESYPVENLEFKQKFFLKLLQKRRAYLLKFMSDSGIIKS